MMVQRLRQGLCLLPSDTMKGVRKRKYYGIQKVCSGWKQTSSLPFYDMEKLHTLSELLFS
jgi:hypothetical protein